MISPDTNKREKIVIEYLKIKKIACAEDHKLHSLPF